MRLSLFAAACVCAGLAAALAQDGAWELRKSVAPGPTTGRFSAVTSGNGFMWIVGGDQNSNGTMQYSWFNSTWTTVATVPWWAVNYTAPVVAWAGGNLFLTGGAVYGIATNTIWQASTTSGRIASWNIVPNPILAPPPRYGHSLPILDGYAFMIGGFNHTNYFGGVWAYDLTQLTKPAVGWQSTTWISVVPDNNTALTAPPPMSGSSVVVYEGLLVLYGGFTHDTSVPFVRHEDCQQNPALQCVFYGDVWSWAPPIPVTYSPWFKSTINNNILPPGRAFHSAGIVNGETMIVFGGVGLAGPLRDLWAFDISFQRWRQLNPTGPAPPLGQSWSVGATIGRHFAVYVPTNPSSMYIYYPPDPTTYSPTPLPTPVVCSAAHLGGVNAGIVITILLGIATAIFAGLSWKLVRVGGTATPADDKAYAQLSL